MEEAEYIPPYGGFEYSSNVPIVLRDFLPRTRHQKFELSRKEFAVLMDALGSEVMTSLLIDNRGLNVNEMLREGFDLRGITIRVNATSRETEGGS